MTAILDDVRWNDANRLAHRRDAVAIASKMLRRNPNIAMADFLTDTMIAHMIECYYRRPENMGSPFVRADVYDVGEYLFTLSRVRVYS